MQVQLFVEIFNFCVYFYEQGVPVIKEDLLGKVLAVVREKLPEMESTEATDAIMQHYRNTLAHIRHCQEHPVEGQRPYTLAL